MRAGFEVAGVRLEGGTLQVQSGIVNRSSESWLPENGWAVGYTKTSTAFITLIEHWNGEEWRIVPSPNFSSGIGSSSVLSCITAVNGNDVWAGGWGRAAACCARV